MINSLPEIRVTFGPSVFAKYKVVAACYSADTFGQDDTLSDEDFQKLSSVVPVIFIEKLKPDKIDSTDQLLVQLVKVFSDAKGEQDLAVQTLLKSNAEKLLCAEYFNYMPILNAVKLAFLVISFVKSYEAMPSEQLTKQIQFLLKQMTANIPESLVRNMMLSARKRKLPYLVLDSAASFISVGHGKNSVLFSHASNQFDSHLGYRIQKDKIHTNAYLKMMGFPTTEQATASSLEECFEEVAKIGFPVVIKPPARGQGKGVTANIQSMDQTKDAYEGAKIYDDNVVLIEKFIEGADFRITVSRSKVNAVTCRVPAFVFGDGKSTIDELITEENERRTSLFSTETVIKFIEKDKTLLYFLRDQGLDLESVPEASQKIVLRGNTNLSTGGVRSFVELAQLHPDNIEMAIDVARLLRLDSIGIDFITPDIGMSWREVGAIIEINAYPMLTADACDLLLKDRFIDMNNGRIETTLIVSDDKTVSNAFIDKQYKTKTGVGFTDCEIVSLDQSDREIGIKSPYHCSVALLLDPNCEHFYLAMTPEQIITQGLPIDRFSTCLFDKNCSDVSAQLKPFTNHQDLQSWLSEHVDTLELV